MCKCIVCGEHGARSWRALEETGFHLNRTGTNKIGYVDHVPNPHTYAHCFGFKTIDIFQSMDQQQCTHTVNTCMWVWVPPTISTYLQRTWVLGRWRRSAPLYLGEQQGRFQTLRVSSWGPEKNEYQARSSGNISHSSLSLSAQNPPPHTVQTTNRGDTSSIKPSRASKCDLSDHKNAGKPRIRYTIFFWMLVSSTLFCI